MTEKTAVSKERRGAFLILEGADCSGKSTLALALGQQAMADGCDFLYLHGSPWPGEVELQHERMRNQAIDALREEAVVVIDHYWVAEQLYGAEYRGAPAYDPTLIDESTLEYGSVMALCVPHDADRQVKMHAERRARGEEHFEKSRGIVERYYALAYGNPNAKGDEYLDRATREGKFASRPDVVLYDMWSHRPDAFAQRLLDKARAFRAIAKGETK